ncbi:MAG TPA: uroporphyrinogen-III C-methyltransferase [Burkholderiales bacterium]|jgi:uroporphyrin-3 C-methyltransferase/uroporphyrinogen III methyltransferase/synthase|nr:uroporphyrinogen-III C-methyltransferase [Burkholderiales bacterium]
MSDPRDLPQNEPLAALPPAAPPAAPLLLDRAAGWRAWWTWPRTALLIALMLFVWNWWSARSQIDSLREEMAQRLRDDDLQARESRTLAREAQERMREALQKMTALESKISESQSQQTALEAMYQDLSRNRDEWALTDIEQTLSLAAQQLQLSGNVRGALIALQNADARLGRADRAQFIAVRRVLQRDIDRLKALPYVDTAGLAIRLDGVISSIDTMPLIFDEKLQPQSVPPQMAPPAKPAVIPLPKPAASEPAKAAPDSGADVAAPPGMWRRLRDEAWDQLRQLVRIRDIGNAEPVLLTPQQTFFLRENLKLRLLNARLSLLQRNEALFREDLKSANLWLTRYFDARSRATVNAQATLAQLSASAVSIELPTLADSLNAVRNFRAPQRPTGK